MTRYYTYNLWLLYLEEKKVFFIKMIFQSVPIRNSTADSLYFARDRLLYYFLCMLFKKYHLPQPSPLQTKSKFAS